MKDDLSRSYRPRRLKEASINGDFAKSIETAAWILGRMEKDSTFFEVSPPRELPMFQSSEIITDKKLGEGEFGAVTEITNFRIPETCGCYECKLAKGPSSTGSPKRIDEETALGQTPSALSTSSQASTPKRIDEETALGQIPTPKVIIVPETQTPPKHNRVDSKVNFAEIVTVTDPDSDTTVYVRTGDSTVGSLAFDDDLSDVDEDWVTKGVKRDARGYMKAHVRRAGWSRFAIKRLRKDLTKETMETAAIDLAAEAKFLASMAHPNVIKLRATTGTPGHPAFAIILDRIVLTLAEKADEWKEEERGKKSVLERLSPFPHKKEVGESHLQRLIALYDIARAMKYLHKNRILFRDLKSDNVGCDVRGDFKIFDFGLARELIQKDLVVPPDGYQLTGATGSRRYMSPENLLCKEYGFSSDVFSFGILFYEVCSLKTPFASYSADKHFKEVIIKGKRPSKKATSWLPAPLDALLDECWSAVPSERPPFQRIYQQLRAEILVLEDKVGSGPGSTIKDRSNHLMERSWSSKQGRVHSFDADKVVRAG